LFFCTTHRWFSDSLPGTFVSRPADALVDQGGDPIVVKMLLSETNQNHPTKWQE
jgi:hypothetical protein